MIINAPLPDRLEYAILQILAGSPFGHCQNDLDSWEKEVGRLVPDCTGLELLAAFKRLWHGGEGALDLIKAEKTERRYYSGDQVDDAFFLNGQFSAILTPSGRTYWEFIRVKKQRASTGSR